MAKRSTDPPARVPESPQGAAAPPGSSPAGGSALPELVMAGSVECGFTELLASLVACGPLCPAGSYDFVEGKLLVAAEA